MKTSGGRNETNLFGARATPDTTSVSADFGPSWNRAGVFYFIFFEFRRIFDA